MSAPRKEIVSPTVPTAIACVIAALVAANLAVAILVRVFEAQADVGATLMLASPCAAAGAGAILAMALRSEGTGLVLRTVVYSVVGCALAAAVSATLAVGPHFLVAIGSAVGGAAFGLALGIVLLPLAWAANRALHDEPAGVRGLLVAGCVYLAVIGVALARPGYRTEGTSTDLAHATLFVGFAAGVFALAADLMRREDMRALAIRGVVVVIAIAGGVYFRANEGAAKLAVRVRDVIDPPAVVGGTSALAFEDLVAADRGACARTGKDWYCWGKNDGRFAGVTGDSFDAVKVTGQRTWKSLALAHRAACAIEDDDRVSCWKSGTPSARVTRAGAVTALAVTSDHAYAIAKDDKTVIGWSFGGDGGGRVPGIENAIALSASLGHVCALVEGGSVFCLGKNKLGELGFPPDEEDGPARALPEAPSDVAKIFAGAGSTFAITRGGEVWVWGARQIGIESSYPIGVDGGSIADAGTKDGGVLDALPLKPIADPAARRIEALKGAVEIGAGREFGCARFADGHVQCWGSRELATLGDGLAASFEKRFRVIGPLPGAPTATHLRVDVEGACLTGPQSITCWGRL